MHDIVPIRQIVPNGIMSQIINNISTLGAFIRHERLCQSLTLESLSRKADVGVRFLSELERGKPTAQVGKIFTVLEALKIEVVLQKKSVKPGFGNVFNGMDFKIMKQDKSVVGN